MGTDAYVLELTLLESLFLSDSLSIFTQGPPDAPLNQLSPYPILLLKIGGAALEADQTKKTVEMSVSLAELWMIREVTKSSIVVGSERVGLNLLIKVYEALRTLSAEPDMQSIVNTFGEVSENEPTYKESLEARPQEVDDGSRKSSESNESSSDHDTATAA